MVTVKRQNRYRKKMVTVKRHNRYRKKNGYRGKTQSVPKKTWLPWKNFHGTDFVFYGYRGLRFHGTDRVPIRYRYRLAYSLLMGNYLYRKFLLQ